MIEIKKNPLGGTGFDAVHIFETWKLVFITSAEQYGELKRFKRHNLTDEVFILIRGSATLYTLDEEYSLLRTEMLPELAYVVKKATWHHLSVSGDALIAVVENSNTSRENTEDLTVSEWRKIKERKEC